MLWAKEAAVITRGIESALRKPENIGGRFDPKIINKKTLPE
jgi:hypothetical protein